MDWKKVVLVSVFSVLASILPMISVVGVVVAISLLIYMLINGMDKCIISNLGLALEFTGLLLYAIGALTYLNPSYSNFSSIIHVGVYLLIGGLILLLVGVLIVMIVKNKLKENI